VAAVAVRNAKSSGGGGNAKLQPRSSGSGNGGDGGMAAVLRRLAVARARRLRLRHCSGVVVMATGCSRTVAAATAQQGLVVGTAVLRRQPQRSGRELPAGGSRQQGWLW
jgi:hypothetical protein